MYMENEIKKMVETPADVLDKTIGMAQGAIKQFEKNKEVKKARSFWKMLGPGLTTGAADDDPSGIATYSQTGARYGFQLLWLSLFTFPFMALVQEMCARLGLVTGRGLAANMRRHFPRWTLYLCTILLFIANTLNIGADLGAMVKATQLLIPQVSFGIVIFFFTFISLLLQIFTTYHAYAKFLKYLTFILFSYVISAFLIRLDWQQVAWHTFVPSITFSKEQIILICAILGTTISPYLFFWQTSQEVEEEILSGKTTIAMREEITTAKQIKEMKIDVWTGMFISNLIMFFIIATCAAMLNANGITTITTAAEAAAALRPIAGNNAYLLFTFGIIGTGMLAIPILAGSASYALSESLRWKYGLYRKLKEASAFYGAIIIAMLVGLGMNFVGIDPIKALLYSAVVNGLVAPVVLIFIVLLSSNAKIMGKHANTPFTTAAGWIITSVMVLAGTATIFALFI